MIPQSKARRIIEKAKAEKIRIVVYGLGTYWRQIGSEVMERMNIHPNYYCDKEKTVLESFKSPLHKTISFEELVDSKEKTLIIVFLSPKHYEKVLIQFMDNENLEIITLIDLFDDDLLIRDFFDLGTNQRFDLESIEDYYVSDTYYDKKDCYDDFRKAIKYNSVAIYTCITGGYDSINQPLCVEKNCDYYLITDEKCDKENAGAYKWVDIRNIVPKTIVDNIDRNRYCKMHGHDLFKDYDYSIYVDGNIQIIGNITSLLDELNEYGLGFHKHPCAYDPYMEALFMMASNRASRDELSDFLQLLLNEGLPRHYGCVECGVVVKDNRNELAKQISENWFSNYVISGIKRDQPTIIQTLFQMNIPTECVTRYKYDLRNNGITKLNSTHQKR